MRRRVAWAVGEKFNPEIRCRIVSEVRVRCCEISVLPAHKLFVDGPFTEPVKRPTKLKLRASDQGRGKMKGARCSKHAASWPAILRLEPIAAFREGCGWCARRGKRPPLRRDSNRARGRLISARRLIPGIPFRQRRGFLHGMRVAGSYALQSSFLGWCIDRPEGKRKGARHP